MRTFLKHDPKFCSSCPLRRQSCKTQYVPTEIYYRDVQENKNPKVDVLVIGESPGYNEDIQGKPCVGDAGRDVKQAIDDAGLGGVTAYCTLVRCRPVDGNKNRPPVIEEISACRNYILQDIEYLKPKVVILMGSIVIHSLTTNADWKSKGINLIKGDYYTDNGITYFATVNPHSYLISKSYIERKQFFGHIKNVAKFLSGHSNIYASKGTSTLLDTEKDVEDFISLVKSFPKENYEIVPGIGLDTETENLNRVAKNDLLSIQFAIDNNVGFVIPVKHPESPFISKIDWLISRLLDLFTSMAPFSYWIAHNGKFDGWQILRFLGIKRLAKPIIDTLYLEYLGDENLRSKDDNVEGVGTFTAFDLKSLSKNKLGFHHYDQEVLKAREESGGMARLPLYENGKCVSSFVDYGGMDAYVGRRLMCVQVEELAEQHYLEQALRLAIKWDARVTTLYSKMESNGLPLDTQQLDYLGSEESPIIARLAEIPKEILATPEGKKANDLAIGMDPKIAGMKPLFGKKPIVWDIGKPAHKRALLIDACGLEPVGVGKDEVTPSVDKKFYEFHEDHELVKLVQEYTGLEKLRTSYINSVRHELETNDDNKADGRVHASFHSTRTVTGRGATSNPNTSQLPSATNEAKAGIKSMYGASPGHIIMEGDYSQAEVRWWAQISNDLKFAGLFREMKNKRDIYHKNPTPELAKEVKLTCDMHRQVASSMNQITLEQVTKTQRQGAKALCVVGDTLVRTQNGLEKIEDIYKNWEGAINVETRKGVESASHVYHFTVDKTAKIITSAGFELQGRPEHPILVWRDCKLQLVELQELSDTDRIIIRREAHMWPYSSKGATPYIWERKPGQTGIVPYACNMPEKITGDLARLAGYITSEGSVSKKKGIMVGNIDKRIVDDIRNILMSNFGNFAFKENVISKGSVYSSDYTYFILNKRAANYLYINNLAVSGETAPTKTVPSSIFTSNQQIVIEYLRGYFAGDGASSSKVVKSLTASEHLAKQLQVLLLELGIVSYRSYTYRETNKGKGEYWELKIYGRDLQTYWKVLPPVRPLCSIPNRLWNSSNYDNIFGLHDIVRNFRAENDKVGSYHIYPAFPWTGAKEYTVSGCLKNYDVLMTGLRARDISLANDVQEILDNNYFLDTLAHKEVIELQNQHVYDFTVPGSHTFVTQGLISRNTFGSIFGQSTKALAKKLKISVEKAEELQTAFLTRFDRAGKWLTEIEKFAERYNYVESPFGRRRHLEAAFKINPNGAKRQARNSPIQSASSDNMFLSAWRFQNWLEDNDLDKIVRIVNTIHDAILVEMPLDLELMRLIKDQLENCMTNIDQFLLDEFGIKLIVPFEADFKFGLRWGHCLGLEDNPMEEIFDKCKYWDYNLSNGKSWHQLVLESKKD